MRGLGLFGAVDPLLCLRKGPTTSGSGPSISYGSKATQQPQYHIRDCREPLPRKKEDENEKRNSPVRSTALLIHQTMAPAAAALSPSSYDKLFINGAYVASRSVQTLQLRNPKDNSMVTDKVPIANQEDVDLAVSHAEAAFAGPWSRFSAAQRSACLTKLADLMETHLEPILTLDSLTTGNPVSLIPTREKGYIRACLLYYGTIPHGLWKPPSMPAC